MIFWLLTLNHVGASKAGDNTASNNARLRRGTARRPRYFGHRHTVERLRRLKRLRAKMSTNVTTRIVAEEICCPSEVALIEAIVGPMVGVAGVYVNVVTKTAIVSVMAGSGPGRRRRRMAQ